MSNIVNGVMMELEQEFTELVRKQKKTIFKVCYFFSDNREEVEDMFQEVLIRLWKGFPKYRGECNPKTWVWRISLNTCINAERNAGRRIKTSALSLDIDLQDDPMEGARQAQMLYTRISRLDLFDRAVILLWLENMSYDEIAQIVGITPSAVTNRLFRIKEQLKAMKD